MIDGAAQCVESDPDAAACAAVTCLEGTRCEVIDGEAACVPLEPEVDACAAVRCAAGTECVVVDGRAECQASAPNPCAAVLCRVGTTCEVIDGDAVCLPNEPAPFCGGIAAFECPGAGSCVDDPRDDCNPDAGGADCGGICECNVQALCIEGFEFDASPNVCDCVPVPETSPCALVDCFPNQICQVQDGEAVCVPVEPDPCETSLILCAPGSECVARNGEATCEPVPADCD